MAENSVIDTLHRLVVSALTQTAAQLPPLSAAEWDEVYRRGRRMHVEGLVVEALTNFVAEEQQPPEDELMRWQLAAAELAAHHEAQRKEIALIGRVLDEAGVRWALLKGEGCALMYPVADMRHPGDIDLYVEASEVDRALKALEEAGIYAPEKKADNGKHHTIHHNHLSIDLHRYAAVMPGFAQNRQFQYYMRRGLAEAQRVDIGGGVTVPVLPPEANVLHIFYHWLNQLLVPHPKFKHLPDLPMMLVYYAATLDRKLLRRMLRDTEMMYAWQLAGCLLVDYFGSRPQDVPFYTTLYTRRARRLAKIIERECYGYDLDPERPEGFVSGKWLTLKAQAAVAWRRKSVFPADALAETLRIFRNGLINALLLRTHHEPEE